MVFLTPDNLYNKQRMTKYFLVLNLFCAISNKVSDFMIDLDRDDGPTNASDEPRGGAGIEPPRHAPETIGARENAGSHTMAFMIKRGQIEILSLGQTSSWIDVLLAVPTLHSFDTANRRSSSEMTQKAAVSQSTNKQFKNEKNGVKIRILQTNIQLF